MKQKSIHLLIAGALSVASTAAFAQEADIPYINVSPGKISASEAQARGTPAQDPSFIPGTPVSNRVSSEALRRQAMSLSDPSYAQEIERQYQEYVPLPQVMQKRVPDFVQKAIDSYKPEQKLNVDPRQNRVIPVGFGFMNSIQTNFNAVAVRTSDEYSIIEVEDGYVYVTPLSDQPISLILYEDGVLESQVSLVLYPIDAPPAMVDLTVNMSPQMIAKANSYQERIKQELEAKEARAREAQFEDRSAPPSNHVAYLAKTLEQVAQQQMPRGFIMTNDIPAHLQYPCRVTIKQTAGQRMTGTREVIDVVLLKNTTDGVYHVKEEMCLTKDALAVAIHDKAFLQPGEETEVYIIRDRFYEQEKQRQITRPRLTTKG